MLGSKFDTHEKTMRLCVFYIFREEPLETRRMKIKLSFNRDHSMNLLEIISL